MAVVFINHEGVAMAHRLVPVCVAVRGIVLWPVLMVQIVFVKVIVLQRLVIVPKLQRITHRPVTDRNPCAGQSHSAV